MSLLHKAITLSGACAIGLTLAFAAPAAAEDTKPINFRAVGGAVLGGIKRKFREDLENLLQ